MIALLRVVEEFGNPELVLAAVHERVDHRLGLLGRCLLFWCMGATLFSATALLLR
jgi:hypothetical protein